jgi:alkylated DNA repair dioxygenase AlkB
MIQIIPEENDQHTLFKYIPNFLDLKTLADITNYLKQTNDWKSGISHNGNHIKRQQKWFQMDNHYFCKKWTDRFDRWKSHKYDDLLINLQNIVQKECDEYLTDINVPNINSILINYYKNGKDGIAFHKDNQISFGEYPTICILSIGTKRTLHFQRTISNKLNRNYQESNLNCEYPLENNSLFIMGGSAQKYWAHAIPTKINEKNPRWSITFREFLN